MPEKIKIVRIISRLNVGGPAQHAVLLCRYFSENVWESLLLSGMEQETEKNMLHLVKDSGIAFQRIGQMKRSVHPIRDIEALYQIWRILRRDRPQIVHTHTAKAGALGRMAAILAGVPVIVHTFHGHVLEGYFGPMRSWVFAFIERLLSKKTTCIVTLTEKLKAEILQRRIRGQLGVRVVPLGLDLEKFRRVERTGKFRRELNVKDETFLLGIVGRLVAIKRHGDLFEALQILVKERWDIHLAVIGGGELEQRLNEEVRNQGLVDRVHFCGFRDDLETFYPDLDCVVLPSANEGMPVCLIEAMACGIPIVATQVGGVTDLLSDCRSCRIVPAENIKGLASAIAEVLGRLSEMRDQAQAHRVKIIDRYSAQQLGRSLEELYKELVS